MTRRRGKQPPPQHPPINETSGVRGILELDRFSSVDLDRWKRLSADLDEYNDVLYFGIEPQRQRFKDDIRAALESVPALPVDICGWTRLVTYRFSLNPLSAAGSLTDFGGRFNIGRDVEKAMQNPWPALYIAEDFETAFREKFQIAMGATSDGLRAEEFALAPLSSFSSVQLDGHIARIFDLGEPANLEKLCAVLRKMKLPVEVSQIQKRLGLPANHAYMVREPGRLVQDVLINNWRIAPAQYGLPATSQIFASMVRDAGFEGIRYPSTKGSGYCIALFPDRIVSELTHLELHDSAPQEIKHRSISMENADQLCGWELLHPRLRPRAESDGES
ncbi:RES family NAD+ phosphorylase [Dyella flagellata]|uniref:RES domain-containing protein n=1 Tax=Dyella flagellata TaxID=1867833 RepID=A0ABQ5XF31_9GAMM|nr:RES family NAD+ phosphorylase [Dyella flagellata]GLQ89145.1 hypothetical protein GCM10007898_27170 [Dyella flagellata]